MPNIRVDMRGGSIMRVLPSMDTSFSGWISNKTRFCYDSIRLQRLLTCLWVVDRNILFSSTTGFLFELIYTGNVILKLT